MASEETEMSDDILATVAKDLDKMSEAELGNFERQLIKRRV